MPTKRVGHSTYCTCYQCNEGGLGRRFRSLRPAPKQPPQPRTTHRTPAPSSRPAGSSNGVGLFLVWLVVVIALAAGVFWISKEDNRASVADWARTNGLMTSDDDVATAPSGSPAGTRNVVAVLATPRPIDTTPEYTVDEIWDVYATNYFAGDQQFKDRVFKVTGRISSLGYSVQYEKNYIRLRSPERRSRAAWCSIRDGDLDGFTELESGQVVTLKGKGSGKEPSTLLTSAEFVMRECTVVDVVDVVDETQ